MPVGEAPADRHPRLGPVLLVCAILAVLAGGYGSFRSQRRHLQERVADELSAIGLLKARQIGEWRAEQLRDATVIMDSSGLVETASRYLDASNASDRQALLTRFEALRRSYGLHDVVLCRSDGTVVLGLGDGAPGIGPEGQAALARAVSLRQPVLTDLHEGPSPLAAHLDVVIPVAVGSRVPGLILHRIDPNRFLFPLIQSWPVPSETAETLLVRRDGDEVLFLNELRHQAGTALRLRLPVSPAGVPAAMAVAGRRGIVEGQDYRGAEVVASLQEVPESDWLMVSKVDASEAYADWTRVSVVTWVLTLAVVLAVVLAAILRGQREAQRQLLARLELAERLSASEERYRTTLLSIGDAVIATDAAGRVSMLNPVAEELTGWPSDEALGQPLEAVFAIRNEHTGEVVESPVAKVLREGVVVGLANHTVLLARDGGPRPIADSGAPIRRADGSIDGVILVFRDQTAERAAAEALTESQRLLLEAQAIAGVGSYEFDIATGQWTSSAVLDAVFGIGPEFERSIEGWGQLIHADDRDGMLAYLAEHVIGAGLPFDRQYRIVRHADGAERWVHGRGQLDYEDGRPRRMIGTIEDITDRLAAEAALRRSAAVDAALAELSAELLKPEATLDQLADATLRHARELTASEHGFASSIDARTGENVLLSWTTMDGEKCRLVESGARVAFGRDAAGRYGALWGYPLNTREPLLTNEPGRHPASIGVPDGHMPVDRFLSVPVIAEDELVGQIAVANAARDYTDDDLEVVRRLAELYGLALRDRRLRASLQESEEQLRRAQRMEAVGRLAGGVAHDFNNMLQTMLGSAEMARLEVVEGSDVAEYLEEIIKAGKRSAALTNQLLAFARQQTISPRMLDLNEAVTGTLRMLGRLIGEDVRIVWQPASRLGLVLMDPAQVDQILANLVVNARDAIAGPGTITIETSEETVEAHADGGETWRVPGRHVVLSISDDGCGMDKDTVAKVFEPFFTTKELGKGTGLGLATVYGIVKQNHGFITIYSEPGQGTTIRIYLPRHDGEVGEAQVQPDAADLPHGEETVLLVEDDAALLQLAARQLRQLGYEVLPAGAPDDALRLAAAYPGTIHLLLSDVVMPGMSGRDLHHRLLELRPDLKCLYMSGYTADVISQRGVLHEGVRFLQKPFNLATLARRVREVLDPSAPPR